MPVAGSQRGALTRRTRVALADAASVVSAELTGLEAAQRLFGEKDEMELAEVEFQEGKLGMQIHQLVVNAVEPGSQAKACGVIVGSMIRSINGIDVEDDAHFLRLMRSTSRPLKAVLLRPLPSGMERAPRQSRKEHHATHR